jgi:carbon storage regulator
MLVLTRKTGEEIRIGSTINVRVLTVSRHRVKLGIFGPRDVSVMRAEICQDVPPDTQQRSPTASLRGKTHP